MSDLALRIADLKTTRQESGDRNYKAEVRGQRSEIRYSCFSNFAIRNSKYDPMLYALCLIKFAIQDNLGA